jgi:fructose-bisphosphate aldolase class II
MKRCIAAGVSKINVNKLVLDNYYRHLKKRVGELPHTLLIEEGVKEVIAQAMEWMDICGSTGKA